MRRSILPDRSGFFAMCACVAVAALAAAPVPADAQSQGRSPAPARGLEQREACSVTWASGSAGPPGAHLDRLGIRDAWRFADGAGQTIAVIDTGVSPSSRLPQLSGGGDLVAGGDGLSDCDAHGTLIAGLIAAVPGADGFAGVAPGASLVSIRQSSAKFSRPRDATNPTTVETPLGSGSEAGAGTLRTLATAIDLAVDSGARIINISEIACVPAGTPLDDGPLHASIETAVLERDVAIVAAAGNIEGACATGNPAFPGRGGPSSRDSLDAVQTLAVPAWYDELVLTVGAVGREGEAAEFSLPGPWVDVAAPGEGLTSLGIRDPGADAVGGELADAVVQPSGAAAPLEGTSFAAPLVAGLVALIRERFPALTAPQVYERITDTAVGRGDDLRIGAGIVDPLAALTAPPGRLRAADPAPVAASIPTGAAAQPAGTSTAAAIGAAAAIAVLGAGLFALLSRARLGSQTSKNGAA
ncbi:type VII secretion-associated serine protease mycosin [Dietzia sp.]|uniref:type VII secretion-associated serine protease mycosin n=1 Tax=Dietzia sp. TaxID=1871616 RepID=UPI002FD8E3E2